MLGTTKDSAMLLEPTTKSPPCPGSLLQDTQTAGSLAMQDCHTYLEGLQSSVAHCEKSKWSQFFLLLSFLVSFI